MQNIGNNTLKIKKMQISNTWKNRVESHLKFALVTETNYRDSPVCRGNYVAINNVESRNFNNKTIG